MNKQIELIRNHLVSLKRCKRCSDMDCTVVVGNLVALPV
jgi:hypothetical protein